MIDRTEFSDELISAYLDGELTADEQSRVEAMLAANTDARRMFDELKTLRSHLQSLPRYSLGDDFAARVLQRAATANAVSENSPPTNSFSTQRSAPVVLPSHIETNHWRRVLWVATSAAACVAVTLVYLNLSGPRDVAFNVAPTGHDSEIANDVSLESEKAADKPQALSATATSDSQPSATPPKMAGAAVSQGQAAPPQSVTVQTPPAPSVATATDSAASDAVAVSRKATRDRTAADVDALPNSPASPAAPPVAAAARLAASGDSKDEAKSQRPLSETLDQNLAKRIAANGAPAGIGGGAPPQSAALKAAKKSTLVADDLAIVRIRISSAAYHDGLIDRLLAKNDIDVLPALAETLTDEKAVTSFRATNAARAKGDDTAAKQEKGAVDAKNLDSDKQRGVEAAKRLDARDLLFVEADVLRMDATLAALAEEKGVEVAFGSAPNLFQKTEPNVDGSSRREQYRVEDLSLEQILREVARRLPERNLDPAAEPRADQAVPAPRPNDKEKASDVAKESERLRERQSVARGRALRFALPTKQDEAAKAPSPIAPLQPAPEEGKPSLLAATPSPRKRVVFLIELHDATSATASEAPAVRNAPPAKPSGDQ